MSATNLHETDESVTYASTYILVYYVSFYCDAKKCLGDFTIRSSVLDKFDNYKLFSKIFIQNLSCQLNKYRYFYLFWN